MTQENFKLLRQIVPELEGIKEYARSEASGFMDLTLDVLYREKGSVVIALSHHFEMNGDLVPDPTMSMRVDLEREAIEPIDYQDQYFYRRTDDPKDMNVKSELNEFLTFWLNNLIKQGHRLEANPDPDSALDFNSPAGP